MNGTLVTIVHSIANRIHSTIELKQIMILLNLIPVIKKLNKIENPDLNYLNVANHTLE